MAWIVAVPPSPRHPRKRWKVVYRDNAGRERSAGIYPTEPAARAVKRRVERGDFDQNAPAITDEATDQRKSLTLFGDYITITWWPRWRDSHPHSAYLYGKRIEKRILPAFGNVRFSDLDADRIGDWKAKMVAEGLAAQTINAYLSLLGTILNAAVDSDYLPARPCAAKAAPAAWRPPRTRRLGVVRCGSPASNSTASPARSALATVHWSWWQPSPGCAG